jgi:hypothetical protein
VVAGKTINTFSVFFCSGGFFKRLNIMAESQFETRALRCAALRCAAPLLGSGYSNILLSCCGGKIRKTKLVTYIGHNF